MLTRLRTRLPRRHQLRFQELSFHRTWWSRRWWGHRTGYLMVSAWFMCYNNPIPQKGNGILKRIHWVMDMACSLASPRRMLRTTWHHWKRSSNPLRKLSTNLREPVMRLPKSRLVAKWCGTKYIYTFIAYITITCRFTDQQEEITWSFNLPCISYVHIYIYNYMFIYNKYIIAASHTRWCIILLTSKVARIHGTACGQDGWQLWVFGSLSHRAETWPPRWEIGKRQIDRVSRKHLNKYIRLEN